MSIGSPPSLYESVLMHDRPIAWWGLDTTNLGGVDTTDDSGNGYSLTEGGTPTSVATLLPRGEGGDALSACVELDGATDYLYTDGTQLTTADAPPNFVASATATSTSTGVSVAVPAVLAGDLLLVHLVNDTATATIASAPSGWTQRGTTLNATHVATATYSRNPSVDEAGTSYEWQWSVADDNVIALLVYRNADPAYSGTGLIFDIGRQATGPAGEHSTQTKANPEQARVVCFWSGNATAGIVPEDPYSTLAVRATLTNAQVSVVATDDVAEFAGTIARTATTGENNARLGATIVTFGAPQQVVNDSLDTLDETISIHAIIRPDTLVSADGVVYKTGSWGLYLEDGNALIFYYRDGAAAEHFIVGPTLSTSTTYHLVVTDDGTDINFYVDGVKTSATRTGAAGYTTASGAFEIGRIFDTFFFDGKIDEVAIWDVAVTDDMVATWYEAYLSGTFGADHLNQYSPRLKIEVAWESAPADACYAWTDVTDFCQGVATSRGRNFELDRMETGRMDFELSNLNGEFLPENVGSPYYPYVIPTRPVRLRAQAEVDGPAYSLFFGYTEGHPVIRPSLGHDSRARFTAADSMKALSLDKVLEQEVRGAELAGTRIEVVLEGIEGIPHTVDAGQSLVVGDDIKGLNRLDHVQVVSATDGGIVFADGSGIVTFQDRHYRVMNEANSRYTYDTDQDAEYRALRLEPEVDEARLFTTAAITPASGNTKTAEDAEAVRQHYRRAKEVQTLHVLDNDAQAMAEGYVGRYSTPRVFIPDFDVRPTTEAAWTAALSHELSHRISTVDRPLGEVSAVNFPTTPILDDFDRANENPLAGNWVGNLSEFQVVSNQLAPTSTASHMIAWNTAMSGPDVEAYVDLVVLPAGDYVIFCARANGSGGGTFYSLEGTTGGFLLVKRIAWAATAIGTFPFTHVDGDAWGIRCVGSTIEAWRRTLGVWTLLGSAVDTANDGTGANTSLALYHDANVGTTARWDNFGGGVTGEFTREHFIERIEHAISTGDWRVKIGVSPAELESNFWLLDIGELGDETGRTSTVLGW